MNRCPKCGRYMTCHMEYVFGGARCLQTCPCGYSTKECTTGMSVESFKGIPIVNHNIVFGKNASKVVIDGKTYNGFYVSYNSYDKPVYGDVTTALVLGQMQKFYILNGDHSEEYAKIISDGFEKCMEYFMKNIHQINKYSDKPSIIHE